MEMLLIELIGLLLNKGGKNMQTLIIYDQTGYILDIRSGYPAPREPVGIPFMWVDVPEGKMVVRVDTSITPHQPVFEDLPPTEIDLLKAKVEEQEQAILELTMALAAIQGGTTDVQ
jgi:hypothetical protein